MAGERAVLRARELEARLERGKPKGRRGSGAEAVEEERFAESHAHRTIYRSAVTAP